MADPTFTSSEPAAAPGEVVLGAVKDAINPVLGHPEPPKLGREGAGGRKGIFDSAAKSAAVQAGAKKIASAIFKV